MTFRFSAPYPYLLDKMQLCFYLSPISVLLTSKICAVKIQNIGKKMMTENSEQASSKKEKSVKTSATRAVRNSNSFRNPGKKDIGFVLCTVCVSDFSVAHGGEKDINRQKDTLKHNGYVDAAQQQRKLANFGASSTTAHLDQKVVKAELLFTCFLVEHNFPLSTADHAGKLFKYMFPDFKIVIKYR